MTDDQTQTVPSSGAATDTVPPPGGGAAFGLRAHSHGAGAESGRSHLVRQASYDAADFPVPTGREEEWRFTPMARLRGLHEGAVPDGKLVVDVDAPDPVRVETVGRDDPRIGSAHTPTDRVSAQAWSSFVHASVVTVPADTVLDRPVTITYRGDGGLAHGHTVIEAGANAEAVVVLEHTGSATVADNVEVVVGEGARLTLVSLQDWDDDAVHVGHQHARVGKDAGYRSVVVTFGGDLVRVSSSVSYDGPGGDAELLGVYFADAGQHLEHRLFVDHAVPRCRSRATYRGALQGDGAHTVWVGDVLIRAAAEGTDTYEANRNLVLSDGARADSVPNLEIETGEVEGAGHASATGRFDDEQLFYLQSRGLSADEAKRLVVRGFFTEIIRQIGVPAIQDALVSRVESELREVGGA